MMGFKSRHDTGQHFPTDKPKSVSSGQVVGDEGRKKITVVDTQKANKIKLTGSQKRMHQAVGDMKNPNFTMSKNDMDFVKNSVNRLAHAGDRRDDPKIVNDLLDASWANEDGIKLDSGFQTQGMDWLKKRKQRNNYGAREEHIVNTMKEIRLHGFHDNGNQHVVFYVPNFDVIAEDGSTMEYHMEAGEISITG